MFVNYIVKLINLMWILSRQTIHNKPPTQQEVYIYHKFNRLCLKSTDFNNVL